MSPVGAARAALLAASTLRLPPEMGSYARVWPGDPAWVPPADGAAVSSVLLKGTLAASGAYTDPTNGLSVPAIVGNYASTPSSAAFDVAEIEHIECVYLSDVTPTATQYSQGRYAAAPNNHFWTYVSTTGTVGIGTSPDGTALINIATTQTLGSVGVTDGSWVWLRRRFTPDDGAGNRVLTVHYSTQSMLLAETAVTWTLLGTATTAGATSIVTGRTAPLTTATLTTGNASATAVKVAYQRLNASIGGAAVYAVDFRRPMTNSFVCETGQTVTIASTFNPSQATGTAQPLYRASGSGLGIPCLDFVSSDSLSVLTGVALAQPFTVSKVFVADAFGPGSVLGLNNAASARFAGVHSTGPKFWLEAGTTLSGGTPVAGTRYRVHYVANGASSKIVVNGTTVASGNAGASAINQLVLGANRFITDGFNYWYFDGRVAWWDVIPADVTALPAYNTYDYWLSRI